jgi:hypothetical protein
MHQIQLMLLDLQHILIANQLLLYIFRYLKPSGCKANYKNATDPKTPLYTDLRIKVNTYQSLSSEVGTP